MLYIAYLPKTKGEKLKERKVNNILRWYMEITSNEYSVIASPGYLSTTKNSIDNYIRQLSDVLNASKKSIKIGFLNGMNGNYAVNGGGKIIEEHYKTLSTYKFVQIRIKSNIKHDHRKMLCFFKSKNDCIEEITYANLNDFLNEVYVGAILIGSSNQSNATYFNLNASKGESDIFMFDTSLDAGIKDFMKQLLLGNQSNYKNDVFEDIVITKSFYGTGHKNTQIFLKNILKDVLESGLEK